MGYEEDLAPRTWVSTLEQRWATRKIWPREPGCPRLNTTMSYEEDLAPRTWVSTLEHAGCPRLNTEGQPRVIPVARTMVKASTTSTAEAMNTATTRPSTSGLPITLPRPRQPPSDAHGNLR